MKQRILAITAIILLTIGTLATLPQTPMVTADAHTVSIDYSEQIHHTATASTIFELIVPVVFATPTFALAVIKIEEFCHNQIKRTPKYRKQQPRSTLVLA